MGHRLALMLVATVLAHACALNSRPTLAPADMAPLWELPMDLERRDLLHGPGGATRAPAANGSFAFLRAKKAGTQPGYDVTDAHGQEWSVKQGIEAQAEVVASRLLWAVGYHQSFLYYVPKWTLTRDGRTSTQPGGRFRLEPPEQSKIGEWSWRNNRFLDTRPMAGLFVMMVMINNWDLKTSNNKIYERTGDSDTRIRYVVSDLGAAFGKTNWFAFRTKDDLKGFEREGFIRRIDRNRVLFHFEGAWREPQLHASVTPDDVRWICGLLNRLSARQWHDAFRAGDYDPEVAERYIRHLQKKIAEGLRLAESE
jgi:hypothetical protein